MADTVLALSYIDANGEVGTVTFGLGEDFDYEADVIGSGLVAQLQASVNGISDGTQYKRTFSNITTYTDKSDLPGDVDVRRGDKVAIFLVDAVNFKTFIVEVPCIADDLPRTAGDRDLLDMGLVPLSTLKTNIEAVVKSPYGNAVTVTKMRAVTRTL